VIHHQERAHTRVRSVDLSKPVHNAYGADPATILLSNAMKLY